MAVVQTAAILPRTGLINTYCLGWLRSEENHCLEVPPPVARQYDKRVRRLLGYTTHGAGHDQLGYYGGSDPAWVQQIEAEAAARGQLPRSVDLHRPLSAEIPAIAETRSGRAVLPILGSGIRSLQYLDFRRQ